eukprot:c17017_g1_i1 orf=660-3065(-)
MDEEAQKRNTDCVYYLASPLTCKKGISCEFRHSETARMNPRDCYYWINSTCRNPNCSFRHPPLEGKPVSSLPPQTSATAAATAPAASTASMPAAALAGKSKTPCYFFPQGHCVKGDKCPFMHGPSLQSSTDAATQQKPPKAPQGESVQASNKPVVLLKTYGTNITKQTTLDNVEKRFGGQNYAQPISSKAPAVPAHEAPQIVKELERARVPENLGTINPYRNEKVLGSRKSRVTLFSDTRDEFLSSVDRLHDMQGLVEKSRQGQPGRKQSQHENERSHPLQAADHRYQNGSRSDAWWKNESPSLDGDGSDQSIQREDGEYSPHLGNRGRTKVFDDSTGYVSKASKSYGQAGSDSVPPQHRQPRYQQHREQQMCHGSDYNGSMEHTKHHNFSSSARSSSRDGQRMISEGYTSSVDLRDHLMKRRRDDRGHYPGSESLPRRGPPDMVDTSHINQRRDENLIQKDHQGRASYRGADYRGSKRPRLDGGASPDGRSSRAMPMRRLGPGRSPDRALSLGSPKHPVLDDFRGEVRERGRDRYASKTAPVSDVRSHLTSSKSVRSEYVKEESGFAAPKSLAQIKAEKMGEAESHVRIVEGRGHRGKRLEGSAKFTDERSSIPANNEDSIASTSRFKRSHADSTSTGKRESAFEDKSTISEDFEGPKPLSLLLKGKKRVEPGDDVEEGMAELEKTEDLTTDLHREVEDGEVRDEEDGWKDDHSHYSDSPMAPLQEQVVSRLASDTNMEKLLEEGHSQGVDEAHDDMGSSEDEMRLGVEMGQTISGDEDYGMDDDDDEDDFAKKLGGFFS